MTNEIIFETRYVTQLPRSEIGVELSLQTNTLYFVDPFRTNKVWEVDKFKSAQVLPKGSTKGYHPPSMFKSLILRLAVPNEEREELYKEWKRRLDSTPTGWTEEWRLIVHNLTNSEEPIKVGVRGYFGDKVYFEYRLGGPLTISTLGGFAYYISPHLENFLEEIPNIMEINL